MRRLLPHMCFLLMLCCTSCSTLKGAPPSDLSPADAERYLKKNMAGYQLVTVDDYQPLHRTEFALTPVVQGDFNGDGRGDICLFVKNRAGSILLISIHNDGSGTMDYVLNVQRLEHFRTVLSVEPPGEVRVSPADVDPPETRSIPSPSILMDELETCGEVLYYWVEDHYEAAYRGL